MASDSSHPQGFRRIDSPERLRRDRRVREPLRPSARVAAGKAEDDRTQAWGGGQEGLPEAAPRTTNRDAAPSSGSDRETPAASTLRQSLDEHARSLGDALVARQVELDRREGDLHSRLAQIEAMRRELEHWSESERATLAGHGAALDERARTLDVEATIRRRELEGREVELRRAFASLETAQRHVEELQHRCETAISMRHAVAEIARRAEIVRASANDDATPEETEPMTTRRFDFDGMNGPKPADATIRAALRVVEPDLEGSSEGPAAVVETMEAERTTIVQLGSSDLVRLHEALLDKERFLAEEARKLDRDRTAFAESRLQWVEGHLRATRGPDAKQALRELRSVREELAAMRDEQVRVQARRHERMRKLLEAIEDEFRRLDVAHSSLPKAMTP